MSTSPRNRRRRWGRRLLGAVAVLLVVLGGLAPLTVATATASGALTGCEHPVPDPAGPFHIAPDNRTITDRDGRPFVTYGTSVSALSDPIFASYPGYIEGQAKTIDIPKINATADVWCGNTVRIQVSQHNVTANGRTCDVAFLAGALDPEVRDAEAHHLVVVINDNTESDPNAGSQKDPTAATVTFWRCVAQHTQDWPGGVRYGQDPQVIFDVFNEPRADACQRGDGGHGPGGPFDLALWRNGGTYPGCGDGPVEYVGMNTLVQRIRQDGARNLLWVQGPGAGSTLAGLTSYLVSDPRRDVVYSVHHPYTKLGAPVGRATWWKAFGYLVDASATRGLAPVVVGEWTNFSAAQTDLPYCWPNAPQAVPEFLGYLAAIGVGLNVYQLSDGTMLQADGPPWTDTTNYTDSPWQPSDCEFTSGWMPPLLGAGQDVLTWFQNQD